MPFIDISNQNNTSQGTANTLQPNTNQAIQGGNSSQANSQTVQFVNQNVDLENLQESNIKNLQMDSSVNEEILPNGIREIQKPTFENTQTVQNGDISEGLEQKIHDLDKIIQDQSSIAGQNPEPKNIESLPNLQQKTYSLGEILATAISMKASDIHISVGYRATVRIDGELKTINSQIMTPENSYQFVKEILVDRKEVDLEKIEQFDLSYNFQSNRFRVNIFKQMNNFSIALRLIPSKILSIDELGLPQIIKEFAKINSGLVLVTGPTGSGKSTTIASILNFINLTYPKHIVTLEDPVEFVFPKGTSLIDQREYGIDFTAWPNALKSILRQDPDVVLVGEMRDYETIASTITVSETGHLVFATLHTNSASQTIDRIIDVFPESQQMQIRTQLANVIQAVVSQRLVPLEGGGRKAVNEIMLASSAVKNAIREGKTHQIDNIIQTSKDLGMFSMEQSLVELVNAGQISVERAKAASNKPAEIDLLLRN